MFYTEVIIIINISCLLNVQTLLGATNCVYLKPLVSVMERHDSSSSFISQLCCCHIYVRYLLYGSVFFSERCVSVPAI